MRDGNAYRIAPGGRIIREWEPSRGLWTNRLWALCSVETWYHQHVQRGTGSEWRLSELLREAQETSAELHSLLVDLEIGAGEAIASPDFTVWRECSDFGFVALTRGDGEPRLLSSVVAGMYLLTRHKDRDDEAEEL